MVEERQVRKLMEEMKKGEGVGRAAMRAGMSENTARRYVRGAGVKGRRAERRYRTRVDPFGEVWREIEGMLEEAPGLEARTIFEQLQKRPGAGWSEGQLRTLQRRIKGWRAKKGPQKEVMFAQEHRPGEACQSDFTVMNELGVTIGGERFDHLLYHLVLPYSNWETGMVCFSESFETLVSGFSRAVETLGKVPRVHRTDNLSAATHALREGGREFNERYGRVMAHYGVEPDRNTPGRGHENGDVEQAHHRFKRAVEQALLVRGSRDFADRSSYETFLGTLMEARNRVRVGKLAEELGAMRELPTIRLEQFRRERTRVTRFSTIRVAGVTYSVSSRLIGELVDVRLYATTVEVWYGGERVAELDKLAEGAVSIDYRHVIWSLVKKPGAFARYKYREALYPTMVFRQAYDALEAKLGTRAEVEYVRILHLAASTSQPRVEAVLSGLLERSELKDYVQVRALAEPPAIAVPQVRVAEVDLSRYDVLLGGAR